MTKIAENGQTFGQTISVEAKDLQAGDMFVEPSSWDGLVITGIYQRREGSFALEVHFSSGARRLFREQETVDVLRGALMERKGVYVVKGDRYHDADGDSEHSELNRVCDKNRLHFQYLTVSEGKARFGGKWVPVMTCKYEPGTSLVPAIFPNSKN